MNITCLYAPTCSHLISTPVHTQVIAELSGLEAELAAARASPHFSGVLRVYEHVEQLLLWVLTVMQVCGSVGEGRMMHYARFSNEGHQLKKVFK